MRTRILDEYLDKVNLHFVNELVTSSLALPLCPCQKDSMETIYKDIHSPEINLKKIQDLIRSAPPDLKIISEESKVIHSHKLLFGLVNSNLAKILLEDDFIGEHVTVFVPVSSAVLVKIIEEGGNWSEIQNIFSNAIATNEEDHHQYRNLKPSKSISITKIEKGEPEIKYDDFPAYNDVEDQPVKIKIQKKSALCDDGSSEKCPKCGREVSNLEVHRIACEQISNRSNQCKAKVTCPLCNKEVNFDYFVSIHYYKCSNWTAPGSDIARANYKYKERLKVDCPTCGKKVNEKYVVKHQENCVGVKRESESEQRRKDGDSFTCHECGKVLTNHLTLKNHIRNIHNPDNIFYHCDKCDYKSPLKALLKQHIKSRHSAPEFFTCHICGKKSKSKQVLRFHHRLKHEVQEMKNCEICGKEIRKLAFTGHMIRAHGEKKFACELCNYRTTTNFNLKLHVSKSHMGLKELPKRKCEYCDLETTNLPYHMGIHHPDKV